jgi:hypothetical protein
VTIDVIGRDVGEHRDIGRERWREIYLIGRDFQHENRLAVAHAQFENRLADIAADFGGVSAR